MIRVVSTKYVMEENLEEFLKIAEEMSRHAIEEKGCISYGMNKDKKDPFRWAFLEEWENEECLENHLATDFLKSHAEKLNLLTFQKGDLMIF